MPTSGYLPQRVEAFGGLNTLLDPTNVPFFCSPDCSDVEFLPGLVRTRPGLISLFSALGGNPTVNYLKSYITPQILLRTLVLDSFGVFYKEQPAGSLAIIGQIEGVELYGNSVSLFGREYIAFGDGKFGAAIPRQYDDTNLDRVSQVGPGAPPSAAEENISATIAASPTGLVQQSRSIAASPNGLTQSGNVVTVTVTVALAPQALLAGDSVIISGAGVTAYNGTWTVASVAANGLSFTFLANTTGLANSGNGTVSLGLTQVTITSPVTGMAPLGTLVTITGAGLSGYNGTWTVRSAAGGGVTFQVYVSTPGLAASGGGTVAMAGNIVQGVHQVSVVFVTRNGYITAPSPPSSWTASGGKRVVVSNIPVGPPGIVVQRILVFTASGGASFFYTTGDPSIFSSNMVITDNSTTSLTVDFSDAILLEGTNADNLFDLLELGECSGVTQYSSRLFWWGERNKIINFVNLSFDGGFGGGVPLGWNPDATNYSGGQIAASSVYGQAYGITGDGVTAIRGLMSQTAVSDAFGNPILSNNTPYSVRVRMALNPSGATFSQGTVHVQLYSPSLSLASGLDLPLTSLTTSFVEYTAALTSGLSNVPSDLAIRVFADGTPTAGAQVMIDCIEVYPTNQPFNASIVRSSKVEDPESYSGVDGFLNVAPENGQAVRCCLVLRNNLYFVKDRSTYVTQDDGTNEPAEWTIQEVSQKVGTLSARGVGLGDEWAIIAGEDGVYYFNGAQPQKISQEIQPTWNQINWNLGYLIDVKVDTRRQRVYIAIPFGSSATANNRVLTLDYTEGFGDSTQTGVGRKWSPWAIGCNSMNMILRFDGTQQLWLGNNASNGKIYQLDSTGSVFSDDGAAINSYWQSGFAQDAARMSFGYLTANVTGSGTCGLTFRKGDQSWLTVGRSWTLSSLGFRNMERQIKFDTERLAVRFGTSAVNDYFSLQGFALWNKTSTYQPIRGING